MKVFGRIVVSVFISFALLFGIAQASSQYQSFSKYLEGIFLEAIQEVETEKIGGPENYALREQIMASDESKTSQNQFYENLLGEYSITTIVPIDLSIPTNPTIEQIIQQAYKKANQTFMIKAMGMGSTRNISIANTVYMQTAYQQEQAKGIESMSKSLSTWEGDKITLQPISNLNACTSTPPSGSPKLASYFGGIVGSVIKAEKTKQLGGSSNYKKFITLSQTDLFKAYTRSNAINAFGSGRIQKSVSLPSVSLATGFRMAIKQAIIHELWKNEAIAWGGDENTCLMRSFFRSEAYKNEKHESLLAYSQYQEPQPTEQVDEETTYTIQEVNAYYQTGKIDKAQIGLIRDNALFTLGSKTAPIIVLEYTDPLCPFCKKLFDAGTIDEILKVGGTSTAYAQLPFPITALHADADTIEQGAYCIKNYYGNAKSHEFLDYVIANNNSNIDLDASFKKFGLTATQITTCVNGGKFEDKVAEQMSKGGTLFGVAGTPTIVFVNPANGAYILLAGAYPTKDFLELLAMAKSTRGIK